MTVSRTVLGDMDTALADWCDKVGQPQNINGVKLSSVIRTSQAEKWRYWRCDLVDGSKVSVNIQTKPSSQKSLLAINHDKLATAAAVEKWRLFWKNF